MITKPFKLVFLIALSVSVIGTVSAQKKPKKSKYTNVVFILADDLGIGDLGCYGQKVIKTPNIDRLAAEGMLFNNHYSGSTVCAPSRSVLMTGQHTGHTSIRDNKGGEGKGAKVEGQTAMEANSITVAEVLKKRGYVTGAFGKWGLGFVGTTGDPNKQGFDEFFGYNCQVIAHRYYPEYLWHNDKKVFLPGNDLTNTVTYAADVIHKKALDFIEKNAEKPFFLFYPSTVPHAELLVPNDEIFQRHSGKYKETPYTVATARKGAAYGEGFEMGAYCPQPQPKATYAAMVERLDQHVGDVVAKLKTLGLDENTLIFFASDNGVHEEGGINPEDFDSNSIYRGNKRDMYDGGIKTPMIANWPAKIKPGSKTDHISAFYDILPTLADVTKADTPSNIDGISMLPLLSGKKKQAKHDYLYWEFHAEGGKQAVRQGKWKAIRLNVLDRSKTIVELYDLENDPAEATDVAAQFPEKVAEFKAIMDKEHVESTVFPFYAAVK